MISPCAACTRRCCHHYLVTITGYDAWVIASGLRLAPEQFLVAVPQREPTARGFRLDRSARRYDIALDKARARTKEKPCVFWLGLPGGGGRCGIYPLRPYVCQTYPAILEGGAVGRREDVLCPAGAWRDGILQAPAWRERLLRMQVEYDLYGLVVARWNVHVDLTPRPEAVSVLGYYAYLMTFYAHLEPVRRGLDPADWTALCAAWAESLARGVSPLAADLPALAPWSATMDSIRAVAASFFPDDPAPDQHLLDGASMSLREPA